MKAKSIIAFAVLILPYLLASCAGTDEKKGDIPPTETKRHPHQLKVPDGYAPFSDSALCGQWQPPDTAIVPELLAKMKPINDMWVHDGYSTYTCSLTGVTMYNGVEYKYDLNAGGYAHLCGIKDSNIDFDSVIVLGAGFDTTFLKYFISIEERMDEDMVYGGGVVVPRDTGVHFTYEMLSNKINVNIYELVYVKDTTFLATVGKFKYSMYRKKMLTVFQYDGNDPTTDPQVIVVIRGIQYPAYEIPEHAGLIPPVLYKLGGNEYLSIPFAPSRATCVDKVLLLHLSNGYLMDQRVIDFGCDNDKHSFGDFNNDGVLDYLKFERHSAKQGSATLADTIFCYTLVNDTFKKIPDKFIPLRKIEIPDVHEDAIVTLEHWFK